MESQRWKEIKQQLSAALELPQSERAAFLERLGAMDPAARVEVESLLVASEQAEAFLETPASVVTNFTDKPARHAWLGRRVGAYEIVAEIGRGGMGEIYKAVRADDQFKKEVAIKLVRQDYATATVVEKFKAERQILANLDHANIARLFDGGITEEGLPYFVMELIHGQPIDTYCKTHRLSIPARLDLFTIVCDAVHYAHQHLVVHRDIKPSNILVTEHGVIKLLDFGVAKILGGDFSAPAQTLTELHALTPEYASPEQVRGHTVTTSSDVYSLGVLLYELLTSRSPYRSNSTLPHEITKEICETEPQRPSALLRSLAQSSADLTVVADAHRLHRQLHGDLDNIVLMALRKEPQRRYASVEQLAIDIRRHLAGLPVSARPDTWTYRFEKFARRNAIGVLASVAAVMALVTGMVVALHEARIANEERNRAQKHFNMVRKLANAFMFEFHDAIKDLPGSTPARELVVKNALAYLDSLAGESSGDASLRRELAAAYEKVGDVQGGFRGGSLGDSKAALGSYEKALMIRRELSTNTTDIDMLRELGATHSKIGDVLVRMGRPREAVMHSRTFLSIATKMHALRPTELESRFTLANSHGDLGLNLAEAGAWNESLESCRKAVALFEQLAAEQPTDKRVKRLLALAYRALARVLVDATSNYQEAVSLYEKALAAIEGQLRAEPASTDLRNIAATLHVGVGTAFARMGESKRAEQHYGRGLAELDALAQADPMSARYRFNVAAASSMFGEMLLKHRAPVRARQFLERALDQFGLLPESSLEDVRTRIAVAVAHARLAIVYRELARAESTARARDMLLQRAHAHYQQALPVLQYARRRQLLTPRDAALSAAADVLAPIGEAGASVAR